MFAGHRARAQKLMVLFHRPCVLLKRWSVGVFLAPQLLFAQALKPLPLSWENATFEGYQCVQATARGEVYLFRSDRWAVQAVAENGELGEASPLHLTSPAQEPRFAVLSPDGEAWLVLAGEPRLFLRGQEVSLAPLPFIPVSAAFLGDTPIVQVSPGVFVGENAGKALEKWRQKPPWLLAWEGGEWQPWAFAPKAPHSAGDEMEDALQLNNVLLASAGKSLVVAWRYAHRYWLLNSQGQPELSLERRSFKLPRRSGEEAEAELREAMKKEGVATENMTIVHASRLTSACLGLATRRDGTVFAVMGKPVTGGGLVLERFDPKAPVVHAVRLDLPYDGRLSLACGKKGLYLAAHSAQKGRWFLPWEMLEKAAWAEVDVEVKGKPHQQ